ncbi:hypothetical protein WR25_12789 isoform B [Diploscapter pachys]|uniref:Ras-associating domain-containing protein n=1 Tax=Diploscapter pachys TaxID=2018661 RepID=A0A2A2K8B5_9BILA|nr:hypothetical protein WR25_12789 isoform A [Diploscapter pachys]PAV70160.1 hypothetical protein WR25_12789 isoform B [Diploscapter pachys]
MDTITKRRLALEEAIDETSESIGALRTGPQNKESDKLIRALSAHLSVLERMRSALSTRDLPSSPEDAKAEAHSSTSAGIYFSPPQDHDEIIVKYKVEWSVYPNFATTFGDYVEVDMTQNPISIRGLEPGLKLSFRISAGGLHGFSEPSICYPLNIELSSWNEVDGRREGWDEHIENISSLTDKIEKHRQSLVWQRVFPASDSLLKKKKNGIKELFTASSKFTKHITRFRTKLINAAISMHHALGIKDIGHLYYLPVTYENSIFLVTVRFLDQHQQVQGLTLRWLTFDKLLRKKMASPAVDALTKETVNILNFFESSQIPLKRGLYLCYMKLHSSLNTIRVVVPDNLPSMLPFVHVRDNPHVTKEEWQWVKSTDINEPFEPTPAQCELHRQLSTATQTLLHDLDIDSDLVPGHRLHHAEIIEPSPDVSIILLLPRAEEVCSAPTGCMVSTDCSEQRRGCSSIPIPVFEMIHQCTYQPEFISTYCRLSIFLEHYMMISQYEQRKCLLENDIKVYKAQYDVLAEFQKELDEIWKNARWISRIATEARDKHVKVSRNAVPLGRLLAPLKPQYLDDTNDVGYHSDQESNGTLRVRKIAHLPTNRPRSLLGSPQESYRDIDALYRRRKISMEIKRRASDIDNKMENGNTSGENSTNHLPDRPTELRMPAGTVTVHSAYDCSLPRGTPVRLSISGNTTSSEVLSLVLEQFAKSSATPDTDILLPDANDYCIVAVVGERERRLKDNFPILKLQPPWSKGKLFVRRRDDLLAAVAIGNEAAV